MKILFALPYLPSLIRVRPYQFVRELVRRHEVSLLASDSRRMLEQTEDLHRWCARVELVPLRFTTSVRSCLGAAVTGDPLQAAVCQSPQLDARLEMMLREDTFDVVHIEHLRAARLGKLVPREIPTLFDAVDSISLLLARTLRSSHSARQRLIAALELQRTRAYETRILRGFDRTIATAPEDARALQALAPSASVSVVPNGVDLDYFQPLELTREPATIVFSGKMSYHANATAVLHFVRRIFPRVKALRPDVRLWIVGSNPPKVIRELAADPAIHVTGHVPDLRAHLGRATVAICPVTVKVGIQNKVLEAMAMGVPVVCTREGAEGLMAVPGRDFLMADSPTEFADQLCALFVDSARAADLASAGRRYVETHHRWGTIVQRLEDMYAELVETRSERRPDPRRP